MTARMGIKKQLKRAQVVNDWAEIVGERIAGETRPDHVRGVILFVDCSGPVWAQQLTLLKPQLLAKIRQRVGPGIIVDIRFRTGRI
jgi:predicted nucleic acid-binding Zn ribbon protein